MTVESRGAGPVGMAAFMNIVPEHRRLEIGHIWYAPSAQRTEANTEAAYLMMREAFDELGYRRVEWKCDALNERSRAAALRLGFAFEGVFRKHMIVRGRSRDSAWFSLLDAQWPAARAALERWLDADPERRPPLASLRGEDR
jgi:RimJ/RimL family protein N-acetyltransferase